MSRKARCAMPRTVTVMLWRHGPVGRDTIDMGMEGSEVVIGIGAGL